MVWRCREGRTIWYGGVRTIWRFREGRMVWRCREGRTIWRCREGRTVWYGGIEKGGPYGMEV